MIKLVESKTLRFFLTSTLIFASYFEPLFADFVPGKCTILDHLKAAFKPIATQSAPVVTQSTPSAAVQLASAASSALPKVSSLPKASGISGRTMLLAAGGIAAISAIGTGIGYWWKKSSPPSIAAMLDAESAEVDQLAQSMADAQNRPLSRRVKLAENAALAAIEQLPAHRNLEAIDEKRQSESFSMGITKREFMQAFQEEFQQHLQRGDFKQATRTLQELNPSGDYEIDQLCRNFRSQLRQAQFRQETERIKHLTPKQLREELFGDAAERAAQRERIEEERRRGDYKYDEDEFPSSSYCEFSTPPRSETDEKYSRARTQQFGSGFAHTYRPRTRLPATPLRAPLSSSCGSSFSAAATAFSPPPSASSSCGSFSSAAATTSSPPPPPSTSASATSSTKPPESPPQQPGWWGRNAPTLLGGIPSTPLSATASTTASARQQDGSRDEKEQAAASSSRLPQPRMIPLLARNGMGYDFNANLCDQMFPPKPPDPEDPRTTRTRPLITQPKALNFHLNDFAFDGVAERFRQHLEHLGVRVQEHVADATQAVQPIFEQTPRVVDDALGRGSYFVQGALEGVSEQRAKATEDVQETIRVTAKETRRTSDHIIKQAALGTASLIALGAGTWALARTKPSPRTGAGFLLAGLAALAQLFCG